MNGNGMTGFNPSIGRKNIEDFSQQGYYRYLDLGEGYYNFFNSLSAAWGSPKAQAFDQIYRSKINQLLDQFVSELRSMVTAAHQAYMDVARTHGYAAFCDIDTNYVSTFGDLPALKGEIDGLVAMNITEVRDTILPKLLNDMRQAVSSINNLPVSIALYDDANGQQHAWQTNIKSFAAKIEEINDGIVNAINNALETEVDIVEASKNRATDILSS